MRSFLLNKLVRDGILPDMERMRQQVVYRTLNDEAFLKALAEKLVEEAREFSLESTEESLKELADVLEVVEALAGQLGSDFDQLRTLQLKRRQKRGGFYDRTFVETVTLADNDIWAGYYAADPVKYPEIKE